MAKRLLNASPWIASIAWTVVLVVLAFAVVAAIATRRGFPTGFAVVGWLYVLLAMGALFDNLAGVLATTKLLNLAAQAMPQAHVHNPVSACLTTARVVFDASR